MRCGAFTFKLVHKQYSAPIALTRVHRASLILCSLGPDGDLCRQHRTAFEQMCLLKRKLRTVPR